MLRSFGYIPQAIVLFVLVGSAAPNFDTSAPSVGDSATINANRASFFALIFASIIGFSAISADFYVYYPKDYPKWMTFATTWSGIWVALIFTNIVGVGIATGVPNIPEWSAAYDISSGALLLECYNGLGGFGGFCVVILSLGAITQNAPCTYSAALTIQVLGRYAEKVPRWAWCVMITIVEVSLSCFLSFFSIRNADRGFSLCSPWLDATFYTPSSKTSSLLWHIGSARTSRSLLKNMFCSISFQRSLSIGPSTIPRRSYPSGLPRSCRFSSVLLELWSACIKFGILVLLRLCLVDMVAILGLGSLSGLRA